MSTLALLAGAIMPAAAQAPPQVAVAAITSRPVDIGLELDGVIQPVRQSTVSAQTSGRIVALAVRAGDHVRAGQLLFTIDDSETQTAVQRSSAQLTQADAELRNTRAQYERTRELQNQGFVSQAALDIAEAQFKAGQAGRDQAQAGVRQSALAQGFTRVSAPYEGWVMQTQADAGDLAFPGKPLLTLYAPLPIRAVAQVPASRAALARAATAIQVQLPDGSWISPVARSSVPAADPVSQTIEWRLELAQDASAGLLPGQQVRVRFAGGKATRLLVPAPAVLRRGELTAVYVATDKGFVLKALRLGADHGVDGIEVLAGLAAGERVALDPVKAGLVGAQALAPAAARP